ncbi:hypothetical protein CTAYLR_007630 [Chrysophaeum taylorii]|uniref:monogalactosyldiacylglycerol synthase n=1 Tax=Chrysophaeum taylorii TaxID=2483200 RepID=A0AAD7UG13_9STRA|nr:hypothetical protein CTAYLR_007630 [Chrysophaeum taylorii]
MRRWWCDGLMVAGALGFAVVQQPRVKVGLGAVQQDRALTEWRPLANGQPASPEKQRILLLMSDTGGGHRASAEAIAHALEKLFPERWECEILDIWTEHAAWPYSNFVPFYSFLAKKPMLWRMLWIYGNFPLTRFAQEKAAALSCFKRFKQVLEERIEDLDVVVSVHPLCQTIPLRALRKLKRGVPFVTVVTDLASAHPTWFHRGVDKCFVPSKAIYDKARRCGLPTDKLVSRGLPLRAPFWEQEHRTQPEVRQHLGLPDVPSVLVMGGGDGVGRIARVAKTIASELRDEASLVVICGKNEAAKRELETYDWPDHVRPSILGFVSNIEEYMAAADCVVTKAGPGTIAEAATRGLPVVLSSFLPGQEAGNVKFVVKTHEFGVFKRRPKKIAREIRRLLEDDATRHSMAARALEAAKPDATTDIARDIARLVDTKIAKNPTDLK